MIYYVYNVITLTITKLDLHFTFYKVGSVSEQNKRRNILHREHARDFVVKYLLQDFQR